MRKTIGRLAAIGSLAAGLAFGLMGGMPAGAATVPAPASCYQHSCDGLDPTLSYLNGTNPKAFCSAGAGDSSDLPNGVRVLGGGLLELRWGPNCQTNLTRFTPANNDEYWIWIKGSSGVTAGTGTDNPYDFSNEKGVAQYSDQVWSPGPAVAYVWDISTDQCIDFNQATEKTEPC
jgi:hypothetical protein